MTGSDVMREGDVSRRSFLKKLVGGMVGLTTVLFAAPVVRYIFPVSEKGGSNILTNADGEAIPASEIREGAQFIGLSKDGPTIVVRREKKLHAFSAVCTHLGCLVKWIPNENIFFCPCHAGRFDANGVNISGPPPSPLAAYNVEINKEGFIALAKI